MPKHTKKRETFAASPPFDSPQDMDLSQAKAARRTELFAAVPEEGDVNTPTPPKSKSTGHLERAVASFFNHLRRERLTNLLLQKGVGGVVEH